MTVTRRLDKQAALSVVPGIQQGFNLLAIPAMRSKHSPLRNYYEAMAHQGVQQGFHPETPVIAPQWGNVIADHLPLVGMTGSGMLDYNVGRGVGMEMRHGWDHVAEKNPAVTASLSGGEAPQLPRLLQTLRENRPAPVAPEQPVEEAALPISRRNRRRLRRAMPSSLKAILGTGQPDPNAPFADNFRSPVFRHVVGGLEKGTTHPAVDYMQKNWSSDVPAQGQAKKMVGASATAGALSALPGAALHAVADPIGAAGHVLGHAASHVATSAHDAALMHAAEKGRFNTLSAFKLRLMSSGAQAASLPWWHPGRWGRKAVHTAMGAIDPGIKEFTLAGEDLVNVRKKLMEKARASGSERDRANLQVAEQMADKGMKYVHDNGSYGSLAKGLAKDFPRAAALIGKLPPPEPVHAPAPAPVPSPAPTPVPATTPVPAPKPAVVDPAAVKRQKTVTLVKKMLGNAHA